VESRKNAKKKLIIKQLQFTKIMGNQKVVVVDPKLVSHKQLMTTTGIPGLSQPLHFPATGLTLVLTRDEFSTSEAHEATHSFVTQRTSLGLITVLLTNIIHVLAVACADERIPKDDREKQKEIMLRLYYFRNHLSYLYSIPNELWALFTEGKWLTRSNLGPGITHDQLWEQINSKFDQQHKDWFQSRLEEHREALKYLMSIARVYGSVEHAAKAAEWIIVFLPFTLLRIEPREILFDNFERVIGRIPNPKYFLKGLIQDTPEWAPDPDGLHIDKIFEKVTESIDLFTEVRACMDGNLFVNWYKKLQGLIPLNQRYRQFLELLDGNSWNFYLALGTERISQLTKLAQYQRPKTYPPGQVELNNAIQNFFGTRITPKEEIVQTPLTIPPPVAVKSDDGTLTLIVRRDVSHRRALAHFAYRLSSISLTESQLAEDFKEPILCFRSYFKENFSNCEKGLGQCDICRDLKDIYTSAKEKGHREFEPVLVCCKKKKASVIRAETLVFDNTPEIVLPFKMEVMTPPIVVFRDS
jgi:hypothetical protein